ncbi:MAG: elongator complex protein 3 [Desulfovibrionales bacterium]
MALRTFRHPDPARSKTAIRPVFIPFLGCPSRCVYCSQHLLTGVGPVSLEECYRTLEHTLRQAQQRAQNPMEIGFFGGTFTSLPDTWIERFLLLARKYSRQGLITRVRCSTRPDAVSRDKLLFLKELGLSMVEFGIQTFDDAVLKNSNRAYSAQAGIAACRLVKECGLALGIQLLPGLPGHSRRQWLLDVSIACDLLPEAVRIYPCLVLQGTVLEQLWKRGEYTPWGLEQTLFGLCLGVHAFWRQGIRVIRMGVAPEQNLGHHILAGPWHPALGFIVRSRILRTQVRYLAAALSPAGRTLVVPERYLPEIIGYKGEGRRAFTRGEGPERIFTWERDDFLLHDASPPGAESVLQSVSTFKRVV